MSFLNSALVWGLLPLAAVPLIIHLLNKKFPQLFRFSSVKNIRETSAQRSKLFRLRHIILMIVRTVFVAVLLLAFLKPMLDKFHANTAKKGERHVLLLIDHSLSMDYKGESVSCRQRAINEAEKLIDTLGPEDQLNVISVAQIPTSCFVDFSQNQGEGRRFLQSLNLGFTRADFNQANAVAARLLTKVSGRAEVYYFSDFQRKNWANVDFTTLPPQTRMFFVDVGTHKKDNHALLGAGINQSQVLAGDTVGLEVTIGNFAEETFRGPVKVLLDDKVSFEKDSEVAPWSTAKIIIPIPPGKPGLHLCEISLPPDALESDNHFFLSIPVLEKEEVLIVSDDANPEKDATYFLKTALNPFENQQGSLQPTRISSRDISPTRLAGVRKMFITRASKFDESHCAALAKFVFGGGGLVYFLDGKADRENMELLEKAMGPGTMPLKLADHRSIESVGTQAQQINKGDFKSKYLKLFRGTMRQDLSLLEFYDFYQASSTGAGNILLFYTDETPAMASVSHGLGTMLLMNFSVSEFSSNLARQRIFPAWIQELVKSISTEEAPRTSYVAGEMISDEVWRQEMKSELIAPNGRAVQVQGEPLGERYAISFMPDQVGFYTFGKGPAHHAFAVNPSPDESDLRAIEKDLLPEQTSAEQKANFVQGKDDYETLIAGRPIFHWFIFGAIVILILELGFQLLFRRLAR